jgi:hypothetical protein
MQNLLIWLALVMEEKRFDTTAKKSMLPEIQWLGNVDCAEEATKMGILAQFGLKFTFPHLSHLEASLFQLVDSMLGAEEELLCCQPTCQFHLPMRETYSASLKNEKIKFHF